MTIFYNEQVWDWCIFVSDRFGFTGRFDIQTLIHEERTVEKQTNFVHYKFLPWCVIIF